MACYESQATPVTVPLICSNSSAEGTEQHAVGACGMAVHKKPTSHDCAVKAMVSKAPGTRLSKSFLVTEMLSMCGAPGEQGFLLGPVAGGGRLPSRTKRQVP